ncbi:MAG: Zn-ribbon domain-containing protein [Methanobacterium formicicum]|uniref:Zn-ribbon domain-containing protein n=1 Tax=uncultured Methanobacterium sp. TaxID=176306 RepID=UPI002AA67447|nr:Zn-ribbon containing protein [uncultured Methanobacterium sp.]
MHRCIKCGQEYEDSEDLILKGCPNCGSKFFEFHQEGKVQEIKEIKGSSVETIMVKEHGVYEVNLQSLMADESVIVSDEEGKYLIDINYILKKKIKEKDK